MAFYSTRKSVVFIKEESTENTPVVPGSGSDAIAVQEGFGLTPEFQTVENNELSAGVGIKAPIIGAETPSCNVSHYLRHSGTEATAPNYDQLIKSAIGAKVSAITAKTTTTSSTAGTASAAAVLKLASGGSDYQRGHAVLIKDATNGYSIRNVDSISTNDLTLSFNLAAAPASGVTCGRPILYKPSDTPPSNSIWDYRGNGAMVQLGAGMKCTQMTIDGTALDALNASFNFSGSSFYWNPVEITSSTKYLDFTNDDSTYAAVVATGYYTNPHELATAITTAMNLVGTGETATCTYSDTEGKFTIKSTGTVLSLLWNSGSNTANTIGTKIGFSVAADDTGTAATTGYTSDNALTLTAPYSAVSDSNINPLIVKHNEVLFGDSYADYTCTNVQSFSLSVNNTYQDVPEVCSQSGIAAKILNEREVTLNIVANMSAYESSRFKHYRDGDTVKFCFNGGVKVGGNWVAGRCVNVYMPQAKVSAFETTDTNGIVTLNMTVTGFMPSNGDGEVYLNFL